MNSASNPWEADPWDAPNEVADEQFAGFQRRATMPIVWASLRDAGQSVFGRDLKELIGVDVEFYATLDGEEMILMQLAWHGFPDPPEWRLATRDSVQLDQKWASWGYFAALPQAWKLPETNNAPNQ